MDRHAEQPIEPPELLLVRFFPLLIAEELPGPLLDLAAGSCRHGIFAAQAGLPVICCDLSATALAAGRARAERLGVRIEAFAIDLERSQQPPLPAERFGAMLVFRYLYRPLMAAIRECLRPGALLIYETYTEGQAAFGRPRNPAHLLRRGELLETFQDWEVLHSFEGLLNQPARVCAQLVARKPAARSSGAHG